MIHHKAKVGYLLEARDSKGAHITVSALYGPAFEISMISRRFHEHLGFKAPPVRRGRSRHYKSPMGPIAQERILSVEVRISGREADAFVEHLFAVLPAAEAKDVGVVCLSAGSLFHTNMSSWYVPRMEASYSRASGLVGPSPVT